MSHGARPSLNPLDNPVAAYVPGNSPIHRAPAGPKYLLLLLFMVLTSTVVPHPAAVAACGAVPLAALGIAKIPPRTIVAQIWPILPVVAFIVLLQGFLGDWPGAALVGVRILVGMLAAIVATATTRVADLVAAIEKALQPLGATGESIALAIGLVIRMIPLQFTAVKQVLEAHRARGAHGHPVHTGTAITIASLRRAEAVGEALAARGVGDN